MIKEPKTNSFNIVIETLNPRKDEERIKQEQKQRAEHQKRKDLEHAMQQMISWKERYKKFPQLAPIVDAVEKTQRKLKL